MSSLVKYARTPHFPWSRSATEDDRVLHDLSEFETRGAKLMGVVATVKLDGENTSFYRDHIHARSLDYAPHPSRTWVKNLHAKVARDIPKGWRVVGENCFAVHSIRYENLSDYFQVFSIWNEKNECLDWCETMLWTNLLGLKLVPVIYIGPWDEGTVRSLHKDTFEGDPCEGYVVRLFDSFHYKDFGRSVAKFVRKNHVQTDKHWKHKPVQRNGLVGRST